jgi:hypothetical protein
MALDQILEDPEFLDAVASEVRRGSTRGLTGMEVWRGKMRGGGVEAGRESEGMRRELSGSKGEKGI